MKETNLKNMIFLKNLPSNIIDEAIVILKDNKKVKKLQKIDINKAIKEENSKVKNNGYIIKEAEMILNQCFSKVEEKDTKNVKQEYDKKNKKLKRYLIITSAIVFLETIILLIK